jgi:hypothetical protein
LSNDLASRSTIRDSSLQAEGNLSAKKDGTSIFNECVRINTGLLQFEKKIAAYQRFERCCLLKRQFNQKLYAFVRIGHFNAYSLEKAQCKTYEQQRKNSRELIPPLLSDKPGNNNQRYAGKSKD